MNGFSVVFETRDPDNGELTQPGCMEMDLSLRKVIQEAQDAPARSAHVCTEASEWPITGRNKVWVTTAYQSFADGVLYENTVFFPENISESSRCRVARLLLAHL